MVGSGLLDSNDNWVSDDELFEIMNLLDLPIANLEGGILDVSDCNPVFESVEPIDSVAMDGGNTVSALPREPAPGDKNFKLKQPMNVSVSLDGSQSGVLKAPNVDSVSLDGLISGVSQVPNIVIGASRSGVPAISNGSISDGITSVLSQSPSPVSLSNGVHYGAFQAPSPVSVLESSRSCSGEKITSTSSGNDGTSCTRSKRIRNPTYKPWFEMSEEPVKRKSKKKKNLSQLSSGLAAKTRDGPSGSKPPSATIVKESSWLQPPPLPLPPPGNKKCTHCEITKTPQWREGPMGPKTLCNACGVRYKSGRLLPEYRPAASPTFVPSLHSNSHKRVIQMRSGGAAAAVAENEFAYLDPGIILPPPSPEFVPMDSYLFD